MKKKKKKGKKKKKDEDDNEEVEGSFTVSTRYLAGRSVSSQKSSQRQIRDELAGGKTVREISPKRSNQTT
jgi:hypothetical protein